MDNNNIYWQMLAKIWDMRDKAQQEEWLEKNPEYKESFKEDGQNGECS